jgi:sugar transport system substrate-binding protein
MYRPRPARAALGLVAASAALALALTGCSGGASSAPKSQSEKGATIGALYLDAQGFYGGIKKGIEQGAKSDNIKLVGQNSGGDATKESQFMSTLISSGAKAIIMSPVSDTASVPVVRQAHDANIPVVCYNTCLAGAAAKKYVYALVTTDQVKLGEGVGTVAGNYFKKKGVTAPRFGILNCDVYEACRERKKGFKDAILKVLPGAKFVADQAGFEPDKATSTATNILTGDPKIDALFATTDNGTIGAIQGVQNTHRKGKTVVFGNDISQQLAKYLISDPEILIATNGQDPQAMGREAVKQALNAIEGKKVGSYLTTIPTTLFESSDKAKVQGWLDAHADGIP